MSCRWRLNHTPMDTLQNAVCYYNLHGFFLDGSICLQVKQTCKGNGKAKKRLPLKKKMFQVFYLMNMHEDVPFTSMFDLLNESAFKIKVPLCVTQLMHTFLMHTSFIYSYFSLKLVGRSWLVENGLDH